MQKMADEAQAQMPGAMVICPHGPEPVNTGVMGEAGDPHHLHIPQEVVAESDDNDPVMLREWFRLDGQREALLPRLEIIARRLNAFIDVQRDMFGLSDKHIILMGFSQGAGAALYTAYTRSQEIAALVCHSSIVIDKKGSDQNLHCRPQTLFLYGEKDPEFSQSAYHQSFLWIQNYTHNRGVERIIPGLGHYTNSESRLLCGAFMRDALK